MRISQGVYETTSSASLDIIGDPILVFGAAECRFRTLPRLIVRIAELQIDPARLGAYKVALKEEIETSIRVEPGVLTFYAVSLKEHAEQIRLYETRCGPFENREGVVP